jgi:hypothetical protein
MKHIRQLSALVMTGVVAASLLVTAGPASAALGDPTVWFVHGVPGATVEVCVNGMPAKDGFSYRQKFSSVMPAGDYTFALYADGANCIGTPIDVANITRTLETFGNYTIVAGVDDQTGNVRFFWFTNNVANVRRGMSRVSIRPVAVAPAVNVFMNKVKVTDPALAQGDSKTVQQPWGDYATRVKVAGVGTTLLGPVTLSFANKTAVQLFVVGNSTTGFRFLRITQGVSTSI